MFDSDKISAIIDDIMRKIFTGAIKADPDLKASVEAREGNVVAVIIRPLLFGRLSTGVKIQYRIDELYQLIEQAVLEKANDYGVEVRVVREH